MKMLDFAEAQRKAALAELSKYVDSPADRLAQSKAMLGERYLLHPSNQVKRRLVPYGAIR